MRRLACLCGGVEYELHGELETIQVCHCEQCRKAQGTPFATNIPVLEKDFRLIKGESLLKEYESSPGKVRVFCSNCGSPIISKKESVPGVVRVRAGLIEGDLGAKVEFHAFTASKANWWSIDCTENIPQYEGFAP